MNRDHADPSAPWNPREPVGISAAQFEEQVLEWAMAAVGPSHVDITHQARVSGRGGEYAIDIRVRLTMLGEASIDIYLECKHQKRAVERDEIIQLEGKLRATGAHKGVIFSTSGFQRGAIEYAGAHGIATVTVVAGDWLFETKGLGPTPAPPPWANLPEFAGLRADVSETGIRMHTITPDHLDALVDFFLPDGAAGLGG